MLDISMWKEILHKYFHYDLSFLILFFAGRSNEQSRKKACFKKSNFTEAAIYFKLSSSVYIGDSFCFALTSEIPIIQVISWPNSTGFCANPMKLMF